MKLLKQKNNIFSPSLVFFTNDENLNKYSLLVSLRLNTNKGEKIPTFVGMTKEENNYLCVMPTQAGISQYEAEISAFAEMTRRGKINIASFRPQGEISKNPSFGGWGGKDFSLTLEMTRKKNNKKTIIYN